MQENYNLVQKGFQTLHPSMAGYIGREMNSIYHNGWWQEVLMTLPDQARDLPDHGDYGELVDSLDVANCLRLIDRKWRDVFGIKLSIDYRTWAKELMGVRNKIAHIGQQDLEQSYAERALDTMALLCAAFDTEAADKIRDLYRTIRYGSAAGSAAAATSQPVARPGTVAGVLNSSVGGGLPSWREVIQPHPDVAEGRYQTAEFAADLAQVARGEGAFEYRDPVEFFARTYITEGMSGLLVKSLQRIAGVGGEPVIQLKTAFGGGKTHSMLALYHMVKNGVSVDKIPSLKPILDKAGLTELPKANVAVLVGTSLDPNKKKNPANLPGYTVNTIWGEMAYQLVTSAGRPDLYALIREADRHGVSPGSETLKTLLNECGHCLILMDELVAYAKKLYGVSGLPAGSYDNFITLFRKLLRLRAPAITASWLLLSRSLPLKSAARPARLRWRRLSIPLGVWSPSGSLLPPTRALRLCAADCSLTARTRPRAMLFALHSARCIRRTRQTSRWKPRKLSTGIVWCPAIRFIRKYLTVCTTIGQRWSASSAPVAFCA